MVWRSRNAQVKGRGGAVGRKVLKVGIPREEDSGEIILKWFLLKTGLAVGHREEGSRPSSSHTGGEGSNQTGWARFCAEDAICNRCGWS